MTGILKGKKALVTGSNQGLGLEIAKKYVIAGADVMITGRDEALLKNAFKILKNIAIPNQIIAFHACEISSINSVQSLIDTTLEALFGCDILVNNAGVYGPKGPSEEVDWDEWVKTIEINLFGSVLTCRFLVPHFKSQGKGKIIQISGGGATNPLPNISAYAASKAGIIRFMESLAEELKENNIDVNAIAPGALNTRMLEEILAAGPTKVGQAFYDRALIQKEQGGTSLETGANLAVFLASALSDGITGKLISALWDDWEKFPAFAQDLRQSDVYTLRRIIPSDRGFNWGLK